MVVCGFAKRLYSINFIDHNDIFLFSGILVFHRLQDIFVEFGDAFFFFFLVYFQID